MGFIQNLSVYIRMRRVFPQDFEQAKKKLLQKKKQNVCMKFS